MPNIQTRYDRKRGCGWRKEGGMYLVSSGLAAPCGALPIPLCRCPTCGDGIAPSRGWTWVDAGALLAPAVALCRGPEAVNPDRDGERPSCSRCPLGHITGKHGLVWIGGEFYKTTDDFLRESHDQGVSRRIAQLPRELELGKTWVFVAHREAIPVGHRSLMYPEEIAEAVRAGAKGKPGIFHAFKPTAVEYVVKGTETEEELERLEKRGLTLVKIERMQDQELVAEGATS